MQRSFYKRSSFTLIELILYLGIFSGVLLLISSFLILILQARIQYTVISEVEEQGQFLMSTLIETIQSSEIILNPQTGLADVLLSLDSWDDLETPTNFFLSEGVLYLSEGANPALPLHAENVVLTNIQFTNLSSELASGSIQIEFTLSYSSNSSWSQYSYSKTFYGSASLR